MAGRRLQTVLLCCALGLLLACSIADAAKAAKKPAKPSVLPHPVGSGLNHPRALGLQPRRGRYFQALMKQFINAARNGNMPLVLEIQKKLFSLTRPKHHKRALLQPAENACPALANTIQYTNKTAWVAAGNGTSGAQSEGNPPGALPSIRFFTLEPCAEFGCRTSYTLVRQTDGTITCRGPKSSSSPPPPPGVAPPVPPVAVLDFGYFKVYDYDQFWNTDDDNVLGGAASSFKLTNINQATSSVGAIGLSSSLQGTGNTRIEPNIELGLKADTDTIGQINTGLQVSRTVGDIGVLGIKTAIPSVQTSGSFGAVWPGTVTSDREGEPGGSDDNVVFRTNAPALVGYYGKKKH